MGTIANYSGIKPQIGWYKDISGYPGRKINYFYPKYQMSDNKQETNPSENKPMEESKQEQPAAQGEQQGEAKLSKNEQKRLQKLKELEEKKKKKEEEKKKKEDEDVAKGIKKEKKKPEEEIIDPVLYYESRSKIIKGLKENQQKYPYPHKFEVSHQHSKFIKEFDPVCTENGKFIDDRIVSIAGKFCLTLVYLQKLCLF